MIISSIFGGCRIITSVCNKCEKVYCINLLDHTKCDVKEIPASVAPTLIGQLRSKR